MGILEAMYRTILYCSEKYSSHTHERIKVEKSVTWKLLLEYIHIIRSLYHIPLFINECCAESLTELCCCVSSSDENVLQGICAVVSNQDISQTRLHRHHFRVGCCRSRISHPSRN